jgi:hypothetical protein
MNIDIQYFLAKIYIYQTDIITLSNMNLDPNVVKQIEEKMDMVHILCNMITEDNLSKLAKVKYNAKEQRKEREYR